MYFLINYSRQVGRIVKITEFSDGHAAACAKLESEIASLSSGDHNEIVVLQAEDLASLRKSHERYFHDLDKIQLEKGA
jgi:hypothetical protein